MTDFDYEESDDPLRYEAELHAEAELGWAAYEANHGDGITWQQYCEMFESAVEAQYQRLIELRRAEVAEMTCECGHVLDPNVDIEAGVYVCPKCGKGKDKVKWGDIPF